MKARIVEQKDAVIAKPQHSKHVSLAMNKHATIGELLEVMFSMWSMLRLY
jgi:hypothetical protein